MGSKYTWALMLAGAMATALIGVATTMGSGARMIRRLDGQARAALDRAGAQTIHASFTDSRGWLTRHPTLSGGATLDDATRERAAAAVAEVPGIGSVHWAPRTGPHRERTALVPHCQADVDTILKTRTIRFADGSAAIDPASSGLIGEVAAALHPCDGSVIAITGHTDARGDETANLVLSTARALAVRNALARLGIDLAGLRARGVGSTRPILGLDPADPANRRIEFSVIAPASTQPTPVDTPGPG